MITAQRCGTVETAARLWAHECSRVFYDRLINREDQAWFEDLVLELLPRYLKVANVTVIRSLHFLQGEYAKYERESLYYIYSDSAVRHTGATKTDKCF